MAGHYHLPCDRSPQSLHVLIALITAQSRHSWNSSNPIWPSYYIATSHLKVISPSRQVCTYLVYLTVNQVGASANGVVLKLPIREYLGLGDTSTLRNYMLPSYVQHMSRLVSSSSPNYTSQRLDANPHRMCIFAIQYVPNSLQADAP